MSLASTRRSRRFVLPLSPLSSLSAVVLAGLFAIACSSSSSSTPTPTPTKTSDDDASSSSTRTDASSPSNDAGPDGHGEEPCDGDCLKTSLEADIGGVKAPLDRGQYGTDGTGAAQTLHIEAYAGGDPACPKQGSPSPDRTFVLSGIPIGAVGSKLTQADGVTAAYLDYKGDQLPSKPITNATAVEATLVEKDSATPPAWVAVDVKATFPEGTMQGHVFASYCQSLSQ
ncbi:hypothetical protein AKJ09_07923 [Labilithrix luteola]|uniref:Lipoprotein n=1 Tax=Labilithrix luteola TaxID=1391654 RepID=A0A0K1Q793_9BACT|nr:hypothetical protein [Labilithrix luteola]AKV01260.1 hypothetical protein AKJ09_07923 [Labilithrix luteola]